MLEIALWSIQGLLSAAFLIGAAMKIFMSIPRLSAMWPWAGALSPVSVRTIGVVDMLGGLGVVLPMLTHTLPQLTVLAAIGCVALQICAIAFHASRKELDALPVNFVLLPMAAFIVWGRWYLL